MSDAKRKQIAWSCFKEHSADYVLSSYKHRMWKKLKFIEKQLKYMSQSNNIVSLC